MDLIYKEEAYNIIGAAMEVYNEMGHGYLEAVYQECMEIELRARGIPFEAQKEVKLKFKGVELQRRYKADFICYDGVLVEIKALNGIINDHRSQTINYLKGTGYKLGLLINFGAAAGLQYERLVF